jgi:hypothetical protein
MGIQCHQYLELPNLIDLLQLQARSLIQALRLDVLQLQARSLMQALRVDVLQLQARSP